MGFVLFFSSIRIPISVKKEIRRMTFHWVKNYAICRDFTTEEELLYRILWQENESGRAGGKEI
jgi:hypothetical protein